MRKTDAVLLILTLWFMASGNLFAKDRKGLEASFYYPFRYDLDVASDRKDLEFKSDSPGLSINLKTPQKIGVGVSFFQKSFEDLSTDSEYRISNYFFDFLYALPVVDWFNLTLGVGVGQSEVRCLNKICENQYAGKKVTVKRSNSSKFMLNMGFQVGIIYKLNFGFQRINAGKMRIVEDSPQETEIFSIDGTANVYLAGISVEFI